MTTTSTQYETAYRPLMSVVDAVPAESWTSPSPCSGWTVRDVLGHLIETQREFLTGRGVDLGSAPDLSADPAAAWRDHAKRVLEAVSDERLVLTEYDSHFGPTTVGATFEQFYVWDMFVHRWDIARSAGLDARLTDAELDAIDRGADSFGEALYMEGICRRGAEAPPEADREARVLARLGRTA
jgi:uncharacterized protein (TIGR03086 family)